MYNTLPPGLTVTEPPLLTYFQTFMGDLPFADRADAQERWKRANHIDTVCMMVAVLGVYNYYTEEVILLTYLTFEFVRQSLNVRFFHVVLTDDADRLVVTLACVVIRAEASRKAPVVNVYHRVNQILRDRIFVVYRQDNDDFVVICSVRSL